MFKSLFNSIVDFIIRTAEFVKDGVVACINGIGTVGIVLGGMATGVVMYNVVRSNCGDEKTPPKPAAVAPVNTAPANPTTPEPSKPATETAADVVPQVETSAESIDINLEDLGMADEDLVEVEFDEEVIRNKFPEFKAKFGDKFSHLNLNDEQLCDIVIKVMKVAADKVNSVIRTEKEKIAAATTDAVTE